MIDIIILTYVPHFVREITIYGLRLDLSHQHNSNIVLLLAISIWKD